MINAEIIVKYIENNSPITEKDIVNIIYYDSPVAVTKDEIVKILHKLVNEHRISYSQEKGYEISR